MKQFDLQNLNIVENLELLSKIKPEKMIQLIHFLENFGYDVETNTIIYEGEAKLVVKGNAEIFSEKNINLQSNTRELNPKTGSVYVINLNLDDGISNKNENNNLEECCDI